MKNKKRVLLWMSGWIDSTVAAYILKEQWYEVVWVFMKYWVDPEMSEWMEKEDKITENKCCSIESQMAAKKTCDKLWIEFHILNMRDTFHEDVVKYFLDMHKKWLTPNPCIQCNKKIKWWDIFWKLEKFNCDFIATGHYAKIKELEWKKYIQKWDDSKKDQSYYLSVLKHNQIEKILLPLWNFKKEKIKELAEKFWEDEIFKKKESQWVCFYSEDSYVPFLKRHSPELFSEWEIIYINKNWEKKVVWKHNWLPYFTIWQRKWIWVWWFENPVFVFWFRRDKNQVLIWEKNLLFTDKINITDLHLQEKLEKILVNSEKNFFNKIKKFLFREKYFATIRHLWKDLEIEKINFKKEDKNILEIKLKQKVSKTSSWQFLVIYLKDWTAIWNGMII